MLAPAFISDVSMPPAQIGLVIKHTVGSIDTCSWWAKHNKDSDLLSSYELEVVDNEIKGFLLCSLLPAAYNTFSFKIRIKDSNVMYACTFPWASIPPGFVLLGPLKYVTIL